MIIDFHTHFFPDRIARETIVKLEHAANIVAYGEGTLSGLLADMKKDGVALSVNQPVATRAEQVVSVNRKMVELNRQRIPVICFGAMHPDFSGYEEELAFLRINGIKGIKMHPDYQGFCPEESRMFRLYEACAKNGLILLFHAGVDAAYSEVHCCPERLQSVLDIPGLTVILAHMGGYRMWSDVEKHLVGKNLYLDTAYCNEMDNAQFRRIILNHGADRILFATDYPWESARTMKAKLASLDLSGRDLDAIFQGNARRLLHLPADGQPADKQWTGEADRPRQQ